MPSIKNLKSDIGIAAGSEMSWNTKAAGERREFESELRKLADQGLSVAELAEALDKKEQAIRDWATRLGLNMRVSKKGETQP